MRRPVLEHVLALWVDPRAAFIALHSDSSHAFWLDCGPDALAGVSAMGAATSVLMDTPDSPILPALRRELREDAAEPSPAPGFRLGWVGWLGYEFRSQTMGEQHRHDTRHPDALMLRVDRAVVFDHARRRVTLLARGERWSGSLARWRDATIAALLTADDAAPPRPGGVDASTLDTSARDGVTWAHDDATYLGMIGECIREIRDGNAYQLCLTTSARVASRPDPLSTYLSLRESSPAHHGGFLTAGSTAILSASPEQFLRVDPAGLVETRPIKGTRPRGGAGEEDARLAHELVTSEKERAENLMIVDLMRNDLARVCDPATIEVPSLLAVETYPHVHQLVSTVRGHLRPGVDVFDAVEACFPAGSMTGAPKREATRILDRLEGRPRGIYSGAFGHLGFDGRLDLAMVIRTIIVDADGASVGAGGGITALSDPVEELAEVKLKARALLNVLMGEPVAVSSRIEREESLV